MSEVIKLQHYDVVIPSSSSQNMQAHITLVAGVLSGRHYCNLQRCVPESALDITLASLSDKTLQQYDVCFKRWYTFFLENNISIYNPSIPIVILFLTNIFNDGGQYGTINSHRSALSLIVGNMSGDDRITRFCKGVYKLRPPLPRYNVTWDPSTVLNHLASPIQMKV